MYSAAHIVGPFEAATSKHREALITHRQDLDLLRFLVGDVLEIGSPTAGQRKNETMCRGKGVEHFPHRLDTFDVDKRQLPTLLVRQIDSTDE